MGQGDKGTILWGTMGLWDNTSCSVVAHICVTAALLLDDYGDSVRYDSYFCVLASFLSCQMQRFIKAACRLQMHLPDNIMIALIADHDDLVLAKNTRQYLAFPLVGNGLRSWDTT